MLPEWLDYALDENTAAAMFRGLRGSSGTWGELVAGAQAIMGIYQDLPREHVERWYDEGQVLPLIAASRVLDTASQASAEISQDERQALGLTAAVAFGMYANFPSARAAIRRTFWPSSSISPQFAAIIATAAPTLLDQMLPLCEDDSLEKRYLELLSYFFSTGDTTRIEAIREAFIECLLDAPAPFEGSLFRSARLCLEHIFRLSVVRVLHDHCPELPQQYVRRLIDSGVGVLLPPQFNAIVRFQLPTRSDNAIVALPTSTGKTLLGELCLMAALQQQPGLVCYLAPYVALGRQVAQALAAHVPLSVRIHRMIGGEREIAQLDPSSRQEIIVATPERLDALLRTSPDIIPYLRCVVCDEAHSVQNDTRGVRLEGLITRLRLLQEAGHNMRLVLLSAVLSQYDTLRRWIGAPEDSIVTDTWKPTARRVAYWRQDGNLIWYLGDSPIRRSGATADSIVGYYNLPWPNPRFYPTRHPGQVRQQEPLAYANVAYLVDQLSQSYGGQILCICATRDNTRKVARAMAARFPVVEPFPATVAAAIARIESHHRFLLPMSDFLRRGVAFHNATVPHDVRQLIEEAVRNRELIAIAATTTLAEGVDLPFRFAILVDWLTWQGSEQRPMSSLLFKNIAGRCGRAGEFTEGDTIVFDNPLGELDYTHPYHRWYYQRDIFLSEEPGELMSAIERLSSTSERESLEAELASQFTAAIPENPDSENLVDEFSRNVFVTYRRGTNAAIHSILLRITESLLDEEDGALARAASPLQLTPFGKAVNGTLFSPKSCRTIVAVLKEISVPEDSVAGLVKLSSTLLRELGRLPEQSNSDLKKVLTNRSSRFSVKPDDFESVISLWLAGEPLESIFVALPYVQRSTRRPRAQEWFAGLSDVSTWDTEFDKFVDFTRSVFDDFMPWVMRACESLSLFANRPEVTSISWRLWADMIEMGADSRWGVNSLRMRAPGGRKAVAKIGRKWPLPEESLENDPIGAEILKEDLSARQDVEEVFRETIQSAGGPTSPEGRDLRELRVWLWNQVGFRTFDLTEM